MENNFTRHFIKKHRIKSKKELDREERTKRIYSEIVNKRRDMELREEHGNEPNDVFE